MEFNDGYKLMCDLTDSNDHTGCYIVGCKILGEPARNLLKKFEHIKALQELDGHLDSSLYDYRQKTYKDMMKVACENLDANKYEEFYGAT
ncbi:hypothetical protein [Endozoicomonas sp. ISHI1]|uniref:hypothetical protein n=1 Tax=Endozoicomonas sp. ISHI1 TaxID=2825882 RepID=UPI0021474C1B|nr:hypothetical protein [Endozoicomonas sp. ISHI1]